MRLTIIIIFLIAFVARSQDFVLRVSPESGKLAKGQKLLVEHNFDRLYFTTDGSEPSEKSEELKEYNITKTVFIKIRPFHDGRLLDTIIARSFVFNTSTKLPVIHLGVDDADLWDEHRGILSRGKNAVYNAHTEHWENCNFHQNWERPVHFVYIDCTGVEVINQPCGIKIFGESTRRLPDKSLKLIAREDYGDGRFRFNFFPLKAIEEHKQLVIRTSGNDYRKTRFKDMMTTYLARNLGLDYMAYQSVQLYINGDYWGMYNLREKVNKHFLYYNHGAHPDSSNIIMGRWIVQHGSSKDYMKMYKWFEQLDTMDDKAYKKAGKMLDLRNYINFRVLQIYICNKDSRGNIRYWNAENLDKKFRMILYDTDLAFGNASVPYLEDCLSPVRTDWFNPEWSTMFLRRLVENDSFRIDFINQFAHLLNTSLHRDTVIAAANYFTEMLRDELPRPGDDIVKHLRGVPISEAEWIENVKQYHSFAKIRPLRLLPEIERLLSHTGTFLLKVEAKGGRVEVNGNYAQQLPFSGLYFKNIPLPLRVIANEGWRFKGWQNGDTNAHVIVFTDVDTLIVRPVFESLVPELVQQEVGAQKDEKESVIRSSVSVRSVLNYIAYISLLVGFVCFILSFVKFKGIVA